VPYIREWVGGWCGVDGMGGGLRLILGTMGLVAVSKELSVVSKPHYKAKFVNKRDFNSYAYVVDFSRPGHILKNTQL